jgi:LDH2 family malate/lactate/ureidoglycolate dehydrogenase
MLIVPADQLRRIAKDILQAAGTPADLAAVVGDSLVEANLSGHDSHGILRLPGYVSFVRKGDVQPAARASVTHRDRATGRVDGAWGWGQPAMQLATATAIELAEAHGVGCVAVNRCFHIGRIIPYVESVASAGYIGIGVSNAGPAVAPHGGRRRMLGTNPFGWAVPRGHGKEPLSFDIATAGIAEGKLHHARARGKRVAPGLLVTADGRPSVDPNDFFGGGAILPFGGHKGYGVNLLAQVLGCGLAGMDTSRFEGPAGANGPVIIVIDIRPFVSQERFKDEVDALCARILASPPAEGVEAVLLPGDQATAKRREREAGGVPVPKATWSHITAVAGELGVAIDEVPTDPVTHP